MYCIMYWWTFSWCPPICRHCQPCATLASLSATAVCAERYCKAGYWFAENGAHHADPEVSALVTYKLTTLLHKCINGRAPEYLAEFCHPSVDRCQGMRSADSGKLRVPRTQSSFGDRSFTIAGPRTWNNLLDAIRDSSLSFSTFTKLLESYLFVLLPWRL